MKIYLIGFMGCGKSTIGRQLAELLDFAFVDLDDYITEWQGKSIAEIFDTKGEKEFREIERDALGMLSGMVNTVIATGGGTPCFHDNLEWMQTTGMTIYLNTPTHLLAQRLKQETHHRPLLANLNDHELSDFIDKKIHERSSFYNQSEIIYQQTQNDMPVAEDLAELFPFW